MDKTPDISKLILFKKLYAKGMQKKTEMGLLPSSLSIFVAAINQKEFKSQQKLSEFLGCNKAHTSRTLSKLQDKGLIEPLISRNCPIRLTEKGKKIANESTNKKDCLSNCLMDGVTKEETEIFEKVLDKILENAKRITEGV